jgi:hypothetical protein
VDNVGAVDGLEGTKGLVDKVLRACKTGEAEENNARAYLTMVISQVLSANDAMEIRLH